MVYFVAMKTMFLIVHGLNNSNSILKDLATSLNEKGFDYKIVSLSGHEEENLQIGNVKADDWVDDFAKAWFNAKSSVDSSNQKIKIIGYSLGATISEFFFKNNPNEISKLDEAIYFAPAFFIKRRSKIIINLLIYFGIKSIRSLTPKEFRSNHYLPLTAYRALFELSASFNNSIKIISTLLPFKRTIYVHKNDEVVSFRKTKLFAEKFNIPIYQLKKIKSAKYKYNHLIITKDDLGASQWDKVINAIIS